MHIEALRMVSRILAALVFICYLYQIVYLFVPMLKKNRPHGKAIMNRYAVLIAARNEENVLPYLLESIAAQDYPGELVDVYVVADNCTDGTAYTARKHGATVFERFNTKQIGKGYALNFLLGQMKNTGVLDNYDAFLVFDADNLLRPDYISQMNRTCSDGYEAFCGYRNSKNFADNWISSGYALWFIHDSVHLNQSRMLLGTTCAVSGTGFGFRRSLLEKCGGWHFFTLTEDIEFDTWCATHGVRIGFCREAMLYDEQPTSFRQSWRQRTRWVQGGIQVSIKYAAQLLRGILRGGRAGYASFETATLSLGLWCFGTGQRPGHSMHLSHGTLARRISGSGHCGCRHVCVHADSRRADVAWRVGQYQRQQRQKGHGYVHLPLLHDDLRPNCHKCHILQIWLAANIAHRSRAGQQHDDTGVTQQRSVKISRGRL